MKYTIIIIFLIVFLLAIWALLSWLTIKDLEKPNYSLLYRNAGYDIRQYSPYLIAETTVSANGRQALSEGFRNIADYIFGNNSQKQSIAMTAPVTYENTINSKKVSFVMPSEHALATIPTPTSNKITLREVQTRKLAVLSFGWYASQARIERKKQQLVEMLEKDNIKIIGEPAVAYYNPPLSMPLLLRNEILIEVQCSNSRCH